MVKIVPALSTGLTKWCPMSSLHHRSLACRDCKACLLLGKKTLNKLAPVNCHSRDQPTCKHSTQLDELLQTSFNQFVTTFLWCEDAPPGTVSTVGEILVMGEIYCCGPSESFF